MQKRDNFLAFLVALMTVASLLSFGVSVAQSSPPPHPVAAQQQSYHQTNNEPEQDVPLWLNWEFWAAVAAIIAAVFAGVIAYYSTRQYYLSRRSSQEELRAYVGVKPLRIDRIFVGGISRATFALRNAGQTPARRVSHSANFRILPYPLPKNFTFPQLLMKDPSYSNIHPGDAPDAHIGSGESDPTNQFTAAQITQVCAQNSGFRFYLYGTIWYQDIFGNDLWTEFNYSIYPGDNFGFGVGKNPMDFGFEADNQHCEAK